MRNRSDGKQTRQTILQVAEKLFAETGYDGVSIRKITSESNVELSAVNYHFQSKEKLFHAVLAMRVDEMNRMRLALMNEVNLTGDVRSSLEALLNAFCQPFTANDSELGDLSNYRRLLALVINSRRWQSEVFERHYDPIVQILLMNIKSLVKFRDEDDLYWYTSFFLGALANAFAETGRVDRISAGLCDSSDLDKVKNKLIEFTVGGLLHNNVS